MTELFFSMYIKYNAFLNSFIILLSVLATMIITPRRMDVYNRPEIFGGEYVYVGNSAKNFNHHVPMTGPPW